MDYHDAVVKEPADQVHFDPSLVGWTHKSTARTFLVDAMPDTDPVGGPAQKDLVSAQMACGHDATSTDIAPHLEVSAT